MILRVLSVLVLSLIFTPSSLLAQAQNGFATILRKPHVFNYFQTIQPVRITGSNADWYFGERFLFSVPDPSRRTSYWGADVFCKLNCPNCVGVDASTATFKDSEINAGMIEFLGQKVFRDNSSNRHFWVGVAQQFWFGDFIEPDEGFYWSSYAWGEYDSSVMNIWREGQPDNYDEQSLTRSSVNCGCFDASIPTGIADCACNDPQFLRIPICSISCNLFPFQFYYH